MADASRNKTLTFCADGADLRVIDPLIRLSCLPNFARIMSKGNVEHHPPDSAPEWTSNMTGKNPSSHGVYHLKSDFGQA